jgi:eukaryotic-like serine/threonine-protein kinase
MAKEGMNENRLPDREELNPTASYDIPVCGPGTEIGHFCIVEEIGRGGMRVVYLAQDTKLDRHVAIKSIPPIMSRDEKVKSRLKREAKLLASLNHPDIAAIHDIIKGDKGIDYLVLEYIPGDTLADCIAQGPMQSKEILSLSGQIADAFVSAHEHGIVHRDLKPANIKITKEHRVKVLDFGIAKAMSSKDSNAYTTVTEAGQLIGLITGNL